MSADTPNPPAFPTSSVRINSNEEETSGITTSGPGMTLRDYFAAKAMQALLREANSTDGSWFFEANASYEIADAMLAARGGEK